MASLSGFALDPSRNISQYAHTAWRIQDGFFRGTPQAITQTSDGYLWIGTEAGLVRFDGVRFAPWVAPHGEKLPSSRIHSLLGSTDGNLWIGTSRGLAEWNRQALVIVPGESAFIESIVEGSPGQVWITRSQVHDATGPLCDVAADALRCHGTSEGLPFGFAQPLFRDSHGRLWLGNSTGVATWASGEVKNLAAQALRGNDPQTGVSAIEEGADGSMFVGIRRAGRGLGLQQVIGGEWKNVSLPGFNGDQIEVSALLRDRDKALWIATANTGIYRISGEKVEHFGSADGLSSDSAQGFYEDREGNLWVATSRGIDRFHQTPVISYSIREGLTSEDADSVFAAHDGSIWIGNLQALDFIRNGKLSSIGKRDGLPGRLITSLLEDHLGRLWVGIDNRLAVYDQGRFLPINKPDGAPVGVVTALVEDADHNVWAASTQPALYRIQEMKVSDELVPPRIPRVGSIAADPNSGIWLGLANGHLARYKQGKLEVLPTRRPDNHAIRNLLADSDGSLWGATQEGAFLWSNGQEQILDSRNSLPCDEVYTLLKDNRGALWLDMPCGFVAADASELQRWRKEPDAKLNLRVFDAFDGAQPGLTNFRPEGVKSTDGKLWFANENILQVIDPEHLNTNLVPPPVRLEQVIADRKSYTLRENLQLPALTRDIEIDYTALSLMVPEKVRFRYKLQGHDSDWQDPQSRRQAFYTNLPPGNYRFQVIASNNDGIWNNTGAGLGFVVLPAFYQTTWFRIFCIFAAASILGLLYVLRLRRLAAVMQTRFEERLEVRERIARDLHDTLLQGVYSAALHFDLANNKLPEDAPAKPALQRGLELLRQVSQQGRNALRSLRSPQSSTDGIENAISLLPREFALPASVDFVVATEGEPRILRPLIRDEAYLIAREAIINAFRHARATKIEVTVDYAPRSFHIAIHDNGDGIVPEVLKTGREGHWGLAGMRERAEKIGAQLEVFSRVAAGTEIELSVPGTLAFPESANGGFWRWITRLSPERRVSTELSNKESEK